MKDVIIVAIWDKDEEVYTRSVLVDDKVKVLKLKGKKPNKLIIPESLTDRRTLRKVKGLAAYGATIVKAAGK